MSVESEKKRPRLRVAAIIRRDDGKVLLGLHRKAGCETWLFPGGGVDWCESSRLALVREIQEELGLTVRVKNLKLVSETVDPAGTRHLVSLYFECDILDGKITLGGDERVVGAEWFDPEQMKDLRIHPVLTPEHRHLLLKKSEEDLFVESTWV